MVTLKKLSGTVSISVTYLVLGCLAFVIVFIFDVNKIKQIHPYLNYSFAVAFVIQVWATVGILLSSSPDFKVPGRLPMLFASLAVLSFILMGYALFFALPFKKTYLGLEKRNQVVDTGMYALCRHPGVIWFFFIYLFLWLASGKMIVLWAGLLWTALDILHVYIQDRWHFPLMLNGYDVYIKKVPFIIPTKQSLKNSFISKI